MATEVAAQPNADPAVVDPAAAPDAAAVAAKATEDAAAKATADAAAQAAAAAQTPEAKAAAEAKAKADADAKAKLGAPEKYADFKLPEGVALDPVVMGEFSVVAKKHNLSQEAAQEIAEIGAKMSVKTKGDLDAALAKQRSDWVEAAKSDKEIGGEKFDENIAQAKAVFDAFGTPALGSFLIESGMGNHPELLRWAFNVSKHISPDKIHTGRAAAPPKSLYDHPTSRPAA